MDKKVAATEGSIDLDVDTPDTISYEPQREQIRITNPQGMTSTQSGVDVEKAEGVFSELNKQFSNISHQARRLSKQASRASKSAAMSDDVEKAASAASSDELWDLETALRGNRAAEEEAGIKDKHIGTGYAEGLK